MPIARVATETLLALSPNPSKFGQPIEFTATVHSQVAGTGTPTGTVTFTAGGSTLGTKPLTNGRADLSGVTLPVGQSEIVATYSGGGIFLGSSVSRAQVVDKASTTASKVLAAAASLRSVM